jgi:small conductance mechanosensitive channel
VGLLIALSQLGVSIEHLLAGVGIAGFVIGFALQDVLSNFASGMMILIYRPYDVGDMVEVGGVFGKVSSMSLVSSTIHTIDNQTLIIPNNKIWGDVIKNVTDQKVRRIDMEFNISLNVDVDEAIKRFKTICQGEDRILSTPEPLIHLDRITLDAQVFMVRPWVKTSDYWPVRWQLHETIKREFDSAGIKFAAHNNEVTIIS